jgi:actin-related protein 3
LTTPVTKKKITIDMGYEMFMAPEIFFHPEFVNAEW